jgi:hypothetical protein
MGVWLVSLPGPTAPTLETSVARNLRGSRPCPAAAPGNDENMTASEQALRPANRTARASTTNRLRPPAVVSSQAYRDRIPRPAHAGSGGLSARPAERSSQPGTGTLNRRATRPNGLGDGLDTALSVRTVRLPQPGSPTPPLPHHPRKGRAQRHAMTGTAVGSGTARPVRRERTTDARRGRTPSCKSASPLQR